MLVRRLLPEGVAVVASREELCGGVRDLGAPLTRGIFKGIHNDFKTKVMFVRVIRKLVSPYHVSNWESYVSDWEPSNIGGVLFGVLKRTKPHHHWASKPLL